MTSKKKRIRPETRPSHAVDGYSSVAPESGNVSFNGISAKEATEIAHGSFKAMTGASAFDGVGDAVLGDPTREPVGNLTAEEYQKYKGSLPKVGNTWGPRNLRLVHLVDAGVVFVGTSEEEIEQDRRHVFTGQFGITKKQDLEDVSKADKIVAVITRKNYKGLLAANAMTIHSPADYVISLLAKAWGYGFDVARAAASPVEEPDEASRARRRALFYKNHMDDAVVSSVARGGGSPMYPYNQATIYECGHLQEWDSTPNMERVNLRHRTGTGLEWHANGDSTLTVTGDNYVAVLGNDTVHVQGDVNIIAAGTVGIKSYGDTNIDAANDLNLNVGGNLRMMVKGDLIEEIAGHKYVRVGRHHQHNVAGHYRIHSSRDVEVVGTAVTVATTKTDFNVSAARDANISAVNVTDLSSGRHMTIQTGGGIDVTAKDDINVMTSASFQMEAGWDVTTKAYRDVVINAEAGQIDVTGHGMLRLQSRHDKVWVDGVAGFSVLVNDGSATVYAKEGISTWTGDEGNVEIRAARDVKIVAARNNLFASANISHFQSMGDMFTTSGGTIHVYHVPYPEDANGDGYTHDIGNSKEEKPDKYHGNNVGKSPLGKVCARDIEPPSRSSLMKHSHELATGPFKYMPVSGYKGFEVRAFHDGSDEDNPAFWNSTKNKQEQVPPKIDAEKYPEEMKEKRLVTLKTLADLDILNNEDDNPLYSAFLKGVGDRTNDGGVFSNDCEKGEYSNGQVRKQADDERAKPESEPEQIQTREPEEVPHGLNDTVNYPDSTKRGWFFLSEINHVNPTNESCQIVYRGKIRTNVPYPLVDTTNYSGVPNEDKCINTIEYLPPQSLVGTAHLFMEPYWRKDNFRAPIVNYMPSGDQKDNDRLSFEMHCLHVNNEPETLELSNRQIWTTGGIHHTGGIRPKTRVGELSLMSADRTGKRKHLRAVETSYKKEETDKFQEAPEDPRKKMVEDAKKARKKLLEKKGDYGIRPDDSDYEKIRGPEKSK